MLITLCYTSLTLILNTLDIKWYISINPGKTDELVFSQYSKFKRPTRFRLGNVEIAFSNNITCLGISLYKPLTYSSHLKRKIDKLKRGVKSLYKLLRANTLSIRLKLLIFNMAIRPALLYGSPLYGELSKSMLIKLRKLSFGYFI